MWRDAMARLDPGQQYVPHELGLLALVAGQSDLVGRLEAEVATAATLGEPRARQLASTLSTARVASARLWSEFSLTVESTPVDGAPPIRSRRAQRAAEKRWAARKEMQEERSARVG